MATTTTDRLYGESSTVAVKAPVVAVATINIGSTPGTPPVGLMTIGGVAVNEGDRVLLTAQTSPIDNGVYNASASSWARAGDFDGAYDVVNGTLVVQPLAGGTGLFYQLNGVNPITPGTTPITFTPLNNPNQTYPRTQAEFTAGIVPVNTFYPPYMVDRYGTNTVPGTTDMWQAINNADACAHQAGAGVLFIAGALYGVNCTAHGAALTISSSWYCIGGYATIQRIDFNTTTAYYTARANGLVNAAFLGLIIDGQVTTIAAGNTPNVDLGAAGSYGDNALENLWSKPYGVNFALCQGSIIADCTFKNTLRAGLRLDSLDAAATVLANAPPYGPGIALANRVENCKFIRTRGIYGDGFYCEEFDDLELIGCRAYDYQRMGFVTEIQTSGAGANGFRPTNCVAEFGHDAVTSASQSNAGFWIESGGDVTFTACRSKSTALGFVAAAATVTSQGTYEPYTATITFSGCSAVRCHQQAVRLEFAQRGAHVVLDHCDFEVNRGAASYAYNVGGAPAGVEIDFAPPDNVTSARFEINKCTFDMVGFGASGLTQYSGINILNGNVTNVYQMQVDIRDSSIRWLTSAGAADSAVQGLYESNSNGYIADILFSGSVNGGARFTGSALVSNFVNHTTGYCMLSSEIAGSSSVLTLQNMNVSVRAAAAGNATGTLTFQRCKFDIRGQIGWGLVTAEGGSMLDWDPGAKDRTYTGVSTEHKFANVIFGRKLMLNANASLVSTANPVSLDAVGCRWKMNFEVESGLAINLAAGSYTSVLMSGCTFQNQGTSTSSTNAMIFVTNGTPQFAGAGNTFDATFVSGAGGHVVTTNVTSNDAPQTASAPFLTVFGVKAVFAGF